MQQGPKRDSAHKVGSVKSADNYPYFHGLSNQLLSNSLQKQLANVGILIVVV